MNNLIISICATDTEIRLACTYYDIVLTAKGECCSRSWFEYEPTIQNCVGKRYVSCSDTHREIELPFSGNDDIDRNHVYELLFDDDSQFEIILRNSSNGYYDGYVEEKIECLPMYPIDAKKNSLILLVGLPGCGKSTYGRSIRNDIKNSIFYDDIDFMLQSNIMKFRTDLYLGKKVIVANANFCIPHMYRHFIDTMNLIDNDKSIITYCFLPDKEKSIQNIKKRQGKSTTIAKRLIISIHNFEIQYTMNFIQSTHQCKKIQTY
jgi:hypothetical protein